jgi:integrase
VEFGLWLLKRGNRESTVERKLRYLKALHGSPEEMLTQALAKGWVDKSKSCALDVVCQYSEFMGLKIRRPAFRAYQNSELYVPTPDMVKRFVYRIRKIQVKAMVLLSVETGASAGEVWQLCWKDVNFAAKTVTVTGVKGHRTMQYSISDELAAVLMQIPKEDARLFTNVAKADSINESIRDYGKILARETGNPDFLKVHFHTFRHFAVSWHYFKTKDIVETQRFARHCNSNNTLKYVHIVKAWIKESQFEVVYTECKEEFSKYLSEGYELVGNARTEWGYCLKKPKTLA